MFRKARGRRRGGGGGGGGGGKRSGGGIAADDSGFGDNSRALMRMKGDMAVLRNYFDEIAQFSPSLARTVDAEFKTLRTVYELLSIAGGESSSEPSDFVLLLHGRIGGDPRLTERAVVDLWTLMAPEDEGRVKQFLAEMEDRLADSSGSSKSGGVSHDGGRERIPGLRLDEVVAELYAK
uniref:Uncharacterized protein n=1 Tax=Odontella aurita TaxID=265563 RepID=A0A7S4J789_9STRA